MSGRTLLTGPQATPARRGRVASPGVSLRLCPTVPSSPPPSVDQGIGWHRWLLIICGVLLLLFFLLNSQTVKVHLLVASIDMPLIVALVIAALLGGLVGWAVPRLRRNSAGREARAAGV